DGGGGRGGRDGILAVKTLVIEGDGANGNLGQDLTPERAVQTFTLSNYKREIDVAANRTRVEQTRTPTFPYFQGQQPQRQILGVADDIGYNIAPAGAATRVPNAVAQDRRVDILPHPLTTSRAALTPGTTSATALMPNCREVF